MRSRIRVLRAAAMLAGLVVSLGACSYGNDDTNTLGSDPTVTEGGTPRVFALFDPGIQVMPLPNDVVWAADGDPEVELAIEDGDPLAGLKQLVNGLGLLGLSPNMFLTVPVTGAVDPATVELVAFRTDDPQLPALLTGVATGDAAAVVGALAQMEIRTEDDFVAVADAGVLKLLPHTPLTPGAAYAVSVRSTLKDTEGFDVASSIGMEALKSQEPFGASHPFARLEPLRARFNDPDPSTSPPTPSLLDVIQGVTAAVTGAPWTRDQVLVAWTFHTATQTLSLTPTTAGSETVAYPTDGVDPFAATTGALRALSAGFTQNDLRWFVLDAQNQPTVQVPVAVGLPAGALLSPRGIPSDALASIYFGQFQSPIFGTQGQTSDGVPFLIATPAGPEPAAGYPVVVFQHGITRSKSDALALANSLAKAGLATLAIDAPFHGARTAEGASSGDGFFTADLLRDRANVYQAAVDLWETLDVIGTGIELDENPGADLDASRIQFAAHSLGSIIGSAFLSREAPGATPEGRVHRMLLSSPSAQLANVLDDTARSDLQGLVAGLGYTKGTTSYYVFLNIAQWLLDPVDPAYSGIGANPAANLLAVFAFGDPIVSTASSRTFLTNVGLAVGEVIGVDPRTIDPADPGTAPIPAPGAYEFGVPGVPVVHSFLLDPSTRNEETGEVEPYYAGYDESVQGLATVGAQTQAAGFFAGAP